MRTECENGLLRVYADECADLSADQMSALLDDAADYISSDGADYDDPWGEYARRIGSGNLSSYCDCLLAAERHRAQWACAANRGNYR